LSFQYPQEIPGITLADFLRTAKGSGEGEQPGLLEFHKLLQEKMSVLEMDAKYAERYLNHGFSGEKRRKARFSRC